MFSSNIGSRAVVTPSNLRSSPRRIGYSASGEKLYTEQGGKLTRFNFPVFKTLALCSCLLSNVLITGESVKELLFFRVIAQRNCTRALVVLALRVLSLNATLAPRSMSLKVIFLSKNRILLKRVLAYPICRSLLYCAATT